MVDAEIGITYLTEISQGSALLQNTTVETYPLPDATCRKIGLTWRKGSVHFEEFKLLGELIKNL